MGRQAGNPLCIYPWDLVISHVSFLGNFKQKKNPCANLFLLVFTKQSYKKTKPATFETANIAFPIGIQSLLPVKLDESLEKFPLCSTGNDVPAFLWVMRFESCLACCCVAFLPPIFMKLLLFRGEGGNFVNYNNLNKSINIK